MSVSCPECDLCSEPIKIRVLLPCNHNNICLQCFIRFNKNYGGNHCYFCQKPIEAGKEPVAVTDMSLDYQAARDLKPKFNTQYNLYYSDDIVLDALTALYQFQCPECKAILPTIDLYASHMKSHHMNVCCVCYNSGRYPPEACPIFSRSQYLEHLKQHPRCICCNSVCFDAMTLANHMREKHCRCELCAKLNNVKWFRDSQELIEHNQKEHFVCHHPECASENLIAFLTRGELLMHLQKVHGERDREIDITRDFAGAQMNQPNDARERMIQLNKKLMQRLHDCYPNDQQTIQKLRVWAKKLIEDSIDCEEFYKNFSEICGEKKNLIFCDMVASMPDPKKRAELFRIHNGIATLEHSRLPPKSKSINSLNKFEKTPKHQNSPIAPINSAPIHANPIIPQQPPSQQNPPQQNTGGKKKKKKIVISVY